MTGIFSPQWLTIEEFDKVSPCSLLCKEQDAEKLVLDARSDFDARISNLHVLARTEIFLEETAFKPSEMLLPCMLSITADDYCKLYVNGSFVWQGPAPGWPDAYYYQNLDLSSLLHPGKNILAVHLYYQGLVNRVFNSGDRRFGLAACLSLSDGRDLPLHWKYRISDAYSGDTVGYDTQFLENFDSRNWDPEWNTKDIPDDPDWKDMIPYVAADYHLILQETQNLSIKRRRPKVLRSTETSLLLDAGEEITGVLRAVASGTPGSKITLRFAEEQEGGQIRFDMRCNCRYEEVWTLGEGSCALEPFDYKAFRYAELLFEKGTGILRTEFETRHYPLDDTACCLDSDVPFLTDIFRICKNAVRCGTQEAYLDCPSREKGQYLGDALVTAHSQVFLSGNLKMLEKCIRQFAHSSRVCPGLMAVVPGSLMQEVADFSLLWPELLLLHYKFSGDRDFLLEMYPTARGLLEHFSSYAGEDGLLWQVPDKWNLVDWPEQSRDGYDFTLSRPVVAPGPHNVINAYYIGARKTLHQIETILGISSDRASDIPALTQAYRKAFFRSETGLFSDRRNGTHASLHSNALALYFGLAKAAHVPGIVKHITAGNTFRCGPFFSYFVLKGLSKYGFHEEMYALLTNESEHGWVNMLREGASSCFEAWGRDQKWNTSLCHPWSSVPIPVLIEDVLGFHPDPKSPDGFFFAPPKIAALEGFRIAMTVPFQGKQYLITNKDITLCPV